MEHCAPILVTSMLTTLMSRIRNYLMYAKKNKVLADQLTPVFKQIAEQLLPYYCTTVSDNHAHANKVHHLVFLLTQKVKDSFYSGVIKSCLDQNWSLKGLRQAMLALLKTMSVRDCKEPLELIQKQIKAQNLQSTSCVAAFAQQVRQSKKEIQVEDLKNLVESYETDLSTVVAEVEKFRRLGLPQSCITTINPWAYDLKQFDLKLTMDNDLTKLIQTSLSSIVSQVFWTSYFKCQSGVTTDDFFDIIREVCSFCQLTDFYNSSVEHYETVARKEHSLVIQEIIDTIAEFKQGIDFFRTLGKFTATKQSILSIGLSPESSLSASQYLSQLSKYSNLKHLKLGKLSQVLSSSKLTIAKHDPAQLRQNTSSSLHVNLTSADLSIQTVFQGESQIYKIGEGDQNDLQIPNEKKMWECQFTLVSSEGNYLVRDCGRVHPTRVQVSSKIFLKLQKHSIIDFGNCIQFVVDLATHKRKKDLILPTRQNQAHFRDLVILQPEREDKEIESQKDVPTLRLRSIWVNQNNEQGLVPKELILEATKEKTRFKIGRSAKNDGSVNLKELSSEHCTIEYSETVGWVLTENYNERPSSNGTSVFMKSYIEMIEQSPSSLIRVRDGMILAFVNFQAELKLVPKSTTVIANNSQALESSKNDIISNLNHTQKDFLVPGRLNLETEMSFSRPGSGQYADKKQSSNIELGHGSVMENETSNRTLTQIVPRQLQIASYLSQETPTKTQMGFSQHLKQQLLDYTGRSESGITSFMVQEVNIQQADLSNQQIKLNMEDEIMRLGLNSQPSNLNGFSPVSSGKSLEGLQFSATLNSQTVAACKQGFRAPQKQAETQAHILVQMDDKLNQYPSETALQALQTKTFHEVQTSTNFENLQKTLQEIAAQTEPASFHQIDTQTPNVEQMDAQTGCIQQNQEFATQTQSLPVFITPLKVLEDLGVQTESALGLQNSTESANRPTTDFSNFQSQMQMVAAVSLPDIPLETARAQLNNDSIPKEGENQFGYDRYQQETLQFSRVQYVFEIGKEDNKIARDSSDTD